MKKLLILAALSAFVMACAPKQKIATETKSASIQTDSTEHDIIIFDPDFDRWYLSHWSEANDRSLGFYESMNRLGASNWNRFYNLGRYHRVIGNYLDYQPNTDYGLEVNRKLYWYFKYIQETFKVPLLK